MNKIQTIKKLKKLFPGIKGIHDSKEFNDSDGIHLGDGAEGGTIDGVPACDYYDESGLYEFGIYKPFQKALNKLGWEAECYDPGTYIAYKL